MVEKYILELSENFDLNILSLDTKCTGEISWQQGNNMSVIDFVLCNNAMYRHFLEMIIDEEWEMFKISDHNFINLRFQYYKVEKNNDNHVITYNRKKKNVL